MGPENSKGPQTTDSVTPKQPKASIQDKHPDRPWIIKQEHMKNQPVPNKNRIEIKWKNKQQQAECESKLAQVRENFLKARYYSMDEVALVLSIVKLTT